ncbi:MAG TPA: cytochrome c oxidase subunit II [Pyrinomonadaceae bacterium]|jgi:cytochrome c oxidase subunit II|nr:cytochrome c oxidase subunit II [Pyrinomonadaceae bacterium]
MGRILAIAIWVITVASLWMFLSHRWWFPEAISEHGPSVDRQFVITIIVCGIAFAAAQIGLGWAVWKYRDSADKQRATYSHGNNRLEVVWTVVTAVVFISLAVMGQRVWASLHLHSAPAGSYQIEVTAQQFAWNVRYPGKDNIFGKTDVQYIDDSTNPVGLTDTDANGKDDVVGPTLVVPENRPVEIVLKSKDVTHSFWVPQLRFKQDLVPGMAIHVHFTATKVGKYELACAELCGMNHFKMKSYMLVLPQSDFDALVQLGPADFQTKKNQLLDSYQLPQY